MLGCGGAAPPRVRHPHGSPPTRVSPRRGERTHPVHGQSRRPREGPRDRTVVRLAEFTRPRTPRPCHRVFPGAGPRHCPVPPKASEHYATSQANGGLVLPARPSLTLDVPELTRWTWQVTVTSKAPAVTSVTLLGRQRWSRGLAVGHGVWPRPGGHHPLCPRHRGKGPGPAAAGGLGCGKASALVAESTGVHSRPPVTGWVDKDWQERGASASRTQTLPSLPGGAASSASPLQRKVIRHPAAPNWAG